MKRLSLFGSWKRLGVQVGLLAGVGVAFIGGTDPTPAVAMPQCTQEDECSFVKPLFMIIADYSTSMNNIFVTPDPNDVDPTRWQAAVNAIVAMIDADNGYLQGNVLLALMRFGHDPNAGAMGTPIPMDTSGIIDGNKIDVGFYDENAPNKDYYHCNGEAIKTAITTVVPPMNGSLTGIGTWTKGALDRAQAYIQQTWADHPLDKQQRQAGIVLLTDGVWTGPSGTVTMQMGHDPATTAGTLYNNLQVPTYVVAIGDAMGEQFADDIAVAGGTGQAYNAADPAALVGALKMVVQALIEQVIQPVCAPGLPRIMVLLDASSSMLNVGGKAGAMGTTGWDQAREALSGANSLFDQIVFGNQKVENLVHLGLAVFGHNAPAEEEILVNYGPCMKDNFAWALDPNTACGNGCNDPWGGPPITWTFKDGSMVDPFFDVQTLNHMPQCSNLDPIQCTGSGTYVHLGLNMVQSNINAYKAVCNDPMYPYPCDNNTKFINILVTDGAYNSTNMQVQGPLQAMYNEGITTYVIGFGDGINLGQLANMANWGSNGTQMYYDANNQADLEAALASIIEGITFDPCCGFNDCTANPEPTTNEPDPLPGEPDPMPGTTTDTSATDTDATATDTEGTTDATATDATATDATATDATATEATSDTTVSPTTGTEPTSGTGSSDSNTSEPTTTATTNTTQSSGGVNTSGDETESGGGATETGTSGVDDGEGCGCKVDEDGQTRGLLASLVTFGLAGFIRRRRRA